MLSAAPQSVRAFGRDLSICLQFYSRLPLPGAIAGDPWSMADFARASRLAPLAGALIVLPAAAVLAIARDLLGLGPMLAAALAVATTVLASGALHEDGLADVADGFGGGADRARKLAIMKDSRIGAFGTVALALSLIVRIVAIADLAALQGQIAAAAVVAAAAASRGLGLLPLAWLPPARADGLAHSAGDVARRTMLAAAALSLLLGLSLPIVAGAAPWRPALACAAAAMASAGVAVLAGRQIGGATGDVAGAAQQMSEIAFLVGLLVAPGGR